MITEELREIRRQNAAKMNAIRIARRVALTCENCGSTFLVPPSHAKPGVRVQRFCSKPCRYQFMRADKAPNSGGGEWMKGEGNPLWKGGVPIDVRTRQQHTAALATWRRQVFDRDDYTCQRCGLRPKVKNQLRSHHVVRWADNQDLRFAVSNGITLCRHCHDWVHSKANLEREFLD